MNPLRVLIVDDEPLAREKLGLFLKEISDMECIAEVGDGKSAVAAISEMAPDLVFLDIQMPEMDGLQVVREVGGEKMPITIFVTAFSEHALTAFELAAVDYLLKPVEQERFLRAIERVRQFLAGKDRQTWHQQLNTLVDHLPGGKSQYRKRILVRHRHKLVPLILTDLDWVGAAGNYLELHIGESVHTVRATMNQFEQTLDPDHFARIHRSTIVNLDKIAWLEPNAAGDVDVRLKSGKSLVMSRSYKDRLKEIIF